MNAKVPEFLIEMLEKQYGKEITRNYYTRISSKKKDNFSSQYIKM